MEYDWVMDEQWCSTRFRVRYAETDAAGIVHHSSYVVWFEEGRSELSRRLGLPYAELEAEGIDLLVTRVEVLYRSPARYDDLVEVATRVGTLRSRTMTFLYRILRGDDGTLVAEGTTEHLAIRRTTGRPTRIPDRFRKVWSGPVPPSPDFS